MIAASLDIASVFASLHGLFHSTAVLMARDVLVFLAIVFWLSLGYWVYKDARQRIADPLLVGVATLVGLVPPFVGPLVYKLFRPSETLGEARARWAELRLIEQHLLTPRPACPGCDRPVEDDYLACPICGHQLREACRACGAPLEPDWRTCPYCAGPVGRPAATDAPFAAAANGKSASNGHGPLHRERTNGS